MGPGGPHRLKKTTGSAPKWILEVRTPTPARVDVGGSVLDWIFASKMLSWCRLSVFFFCLLFSFFSDASLSFVHPFLDVFCEIDL